MIELQQWLDSIPRGGKEVALMHLADKIGVTLPTLRRYGRGVVEPNRHVGKAILAHIKQHPGG